MPCWPGRVSGTAPGGKNARRRTAWHPTNWKRSTVNGRRWGSISCLRISPRRWRSSLRRPALPRALATFSTSMGASRRRIRVEKRGSRPMETRNMAAVDLGAESGRVMLARFDGQRLGLEEVYRFPNRPVMLRGHRFWHVLARVPREVLYARTGIQVLPFNTIFQLYAHERMQPGELAQAHRLLLIPDLLHSWLCGVLVTERTNATTTQCWDPVAMRWATDLLERLAIPTSMLPPVVEAGTVLGEVLPELRDDLGAVRVITPATHDTGSAIAAAPVSLPGGWGYISSGTWSLVGV